MDRPLVTQVDIVADGESLGVLVRQDGRTCGAWLPHYVHRPWFVQEAVVDAAGIPRVDTLRATERGVTDEGVAAAVVVTRVIMGAVMILL